MFLLFLLPAEPDLTDFPGFRKLYGFLSHGLHLPAFLWLWWADFRLEVFLGLLGTELPEANTLPLTYTI